MVCKECGKEITDETLSYCPECMATLDEPVVINMSKDDIKKASKEFDKKEKELQKKIAETTKETKIVAATDGIDLDVEYEGPFLNLLGFVKSLGTSLSNLLIFISAVAIYISPFLVWLWEMLHKNKNKANLFGMATKPNNILPNGNYSTLALGSTTILVMAILLLASGFIMLLVAAREYIKPMWKLRYNFVFRLVPAVMSIVAFVVIWYEKKYVSALDSMKDLKDMAKTLNQSNVYSYGRGLGPIVCVGGICFYIVATVIDFVKYLRIKKSQE